MKLEIHIDSLDGTQMAAKITGRFAMDGHSFRFTAIAFGRIGGQNVGAKLSDSTQDKLKKLGYDVDDVIASLQSGLLKGDITLPEGLQRESFADS